MRKNLIKEKRHPDLHLFEIEDAGGHPAGILSGMVTEHMHILQQFLETVQEKIHTGADVFTLS